MISYAQSTWQLIAFEKMEQLLHYWLVLNQFDSPNSGVIEHCLRCEAVKYYVLEVLMMI